MTAITDVPGIRVGHAQRTGEGWLTGVTVVLPPPGTIGSVTVGGGAPATHETDALQPGTLVSTVDAVVLTGGSAYGLAAAHGAQRWCEEHGRGFPVGSGSTQGEPAGVVPIVPAAAIFDLGRGGDFQARPDAAMGYAAAAAAAGSGAGNDVGTSGLRGNVGAGTGAAVLQGRYKGGVGTASLALDEDGGCRIMVGALAVVNAAGGPAGAAAPPGDQGGTGGGTPNTTLAVVATNAVLDAGEAKRTASAAHAGLARALVPSHTLVDGDVVFALATGELALPQGGPGGRTGALARLQTLAAEAVRLAILDGVRSAAAVATPAVTLPAYPLG